MVGALASSDAALDGTPPSPLTGAYIVAGTHVGVTNAAPALDIPLPFTGGLLGWVATNGDRVALSFWCESYSSWAQNRTKISLALTAPGGTLIGGSNMVRVNYIAVGW